MFNRGGVSAYGKGIASNLVTEEQRQRFNYGGRVRAQFGLDVMPEIEKDPYGAWWKGIGEADILRKNWHQDIQIKPGGKLVTEEDEDVELDYGQFGRANPGAAAGPIRAPRVDPGLDVVDGKSDELDVWSELLKETPEQKKRRKGTALLTLAGDALRIGAAPTTEKKMTAAAGAADKMAALGTTAADKREAAILQGKVLSEVYKQKGETAGTEAIKLEMLKQGLTGTDANKFNAIYLKTGDLEDSLAGVVGRKAIAAPIDKKTKELDITKLKNYAPGTILKHPDGSYILVQDSATIDEGNDVFEIMAKYKTWLSSQQP